MAATRATPVHRAAFMRLESISILLVISAPLP